MALHRQEHRLGPCGHRLTMRLARDTGTGVLRQVNLMNSTVQSSVVAFWQTTIVNVPGTVREPVVSIITFAVKPSPGGGWPAS